MASWESDRGAGISQTPLQLISESIAVGRIPRGKEEERLWKFLIFSKLLQLSDQNFVERLYPIDLNPIVSKHSYSEKLFDWERVWLFFFDSPEIVYAAVEHYILYWENDNIHKNKSSNNVIVLPSLLILWQYFTEYQVFYATYIV